MAIHHRLNGGGIEHGTHGAARARSIAAMAKYKNTGIHPGKTVNPVGYGTLLHYANEGGYCEPVTFVYDLSVWSGR